MTPGRLHAPGEGRGRGGRASHAVAVSSLARALRAVSRLAALWLAARFFSVAEVGSFAFWLAGGTMAAVLSDLGLSEHLMRAVPAREDGRAGLLRSALRVRLVGGLAIAAATAAVTMAIATGGGWGAAGAFLFGLGIGLADFLAAARRALGRFDVEAVESGLAAAGGLLPAAIVAPLGSFAAFQLALGLGTTAVVLARLSSFGRQLAAPAGDGGPAAREVLAASRWLWLKALVGWSFLDATILLLGVLAGAVEVALFAGAARLVGVMTQPLIALNWVFTPALAHEAAGGGERLHASVRRLNLVGLAAVPAGIAACALAGRLALTGLGDEYRAAAPVLLLLAFGFAVHLGALNAVPLVVLGAERALVRTSLAGLATLLAVTAAVAPAHGATGAAVAVVAGLAVNKLLTVGLYLRHDLPLGTCAQLALAFAVGGWFAAAWATEGRAREIVLAAGGLLGLAAVLALLHRTRLFAPADAPASPREPGPLAP